MKARIPRCRKTPDGTSAVATSTWRKLDGVNGQLARATEAPPAGAPFGVPSFVARPLAVHIDLNALRGHRRVGLPERGRPADAREQLPSTGVGAGDGRGRPDWLPLPRPQTHRRNAGGGSGTSLKALMARIGHASAAAALRCQHVIDGEDADVVRYLERFREEPPVPTRAHHATSMPDSGGHAVGTPADRPPGPGEPQALTRTFVVETMGLEPTTPCLQSRCSSQLSYVP